MKWLIIAVVVLAQQPPKPPERKGTAQSNSAKIANQADTSQSQKKPAASATPTTQPTNATIISKDQISTPTEDPERNEAEHKAHEEDLKIQRKIVWFTGALAIVGFLQAGVMILQWCVYRRQAKIMAHQVGEMTRQRITMRRQLETMNGQLVAMKDAGVQTDNLIQQATKSADAAKASANAFVLSERAWIEVYIAKQPEVQISSTKTQGGGGTNRTIERVWFWPDVKNFGRTPAKMTRIIVVTYQIPRPLGTHTEMPPELPPQPKYDADEQRRVIAVERDMMLAPGMGITPIPIEIQAQEWETVTSRKGTLYLYGFVDYLDVVNEPHQTRFCEVYWVPANSNDPNMQGFTTAGNTPAAYTKSD